MTTKMHVSGLFLILHILWSNRIAAETSCHTAKEQEAFEHDTKVRLSHLTANIKKIRKDLNKLRQPASDPDSRTAVIYDLDELRERTFEYRQLAEQAEQITSVVKNNGAIIAEVMRDHGQAAEQIHLLRNRMNSIVSLCRGNSTVECPSEITGRDCAEILHKGGTYSGVYFLQENPGSVPFPVYCDQKGDGGGWTYIHSHVDNVLDFNRSWLSYKNGFGEVNCNGGGNFWIGNEAIHAITSARRYHLQVDVTDWSDNTGYARYTTFEVGPEDSEYQLHVTGYVPATEPDMRIGNGFFGHNFGHADDIMYTSHDGMNFSSFDRDNDLYQYDCAHQDGGGWWFNRCSAVNLNGRIYNNGFYRATDTLYGFDNAMIWGPWTGLWYSLKTSSMKIRPATFPD